MRFLDLSQPINEGIPVYPGDPLFESRPFAFTGRVTSSALISGRTSTRRFIIFSTAKRSIPFPRISFLGKRHVLISRLLSD